MQNLCDDSKVPHEIDFWKQGVGSGGEDEGALIFS